MAEKTHKKAAKKAAGMLRLRWFRSAIQAPQKHKRVVRGLGFTRLNQIVEREDTDRKSTRLNSSHIQKSRMPSSA